MVELRSASRAIEVIGVLSTWGSSAGRGHGAVGTARSWFGGKARGAGLTVRDRGNVPVPGAEMMDRGDAKARFLVQIARCDKTVAQWVDAALARQATPVVLGGDHSLAAGSIAGVASHFRAQQKGHRPHLD